VAIKNYIVQKYGEHISEKMKERLETAERRILLVSPEDYKTLAEEWVPGSKAEVKDVSGHYTRLGSMVVINDMVENSKDIWNKNKEIFDKFPGGQQSLVLPYIRLSLITETLVHELVHSCEEDAGNEKMKGTRWRYQQLRNSRMRELLCLEIFCQNTGKMFTIYFSVTSLIVLLKKSGTKT